MDNPEFLDSSGKTGKIRKHDRPLFPESVPYPLVDLGSTVSRIHPLLYESAEFLSLWGFEYGVVVEHDFEKLLDNLSHSQIFKKIIYKCSLVGMFSEV